MPLTEDLQRLSKKASQLYEKKDYAGARRLWEEVLKAAPGDPRAAEGYRMASMLSDGASPLTGIGTQGDEVLAQTESIVEMLRGGRAAEALGAARALLEKHPDEVRAREAHAAAMRAHKLEPRIREKIDGARKSLVEGDREAARARCREVFAIDEGNHEAREMLLEIERVEPPAAAPAEEEQRTVGGLVQVGQSGSPGSESEAYALILEPGKRRKSKRPRKAASGGSAPAGPPVGGAAEEEDEILLETGALDLDALDEEVRLVVISEPIDVPAEKPQAARPAAGRTATVAEAPQVPTAAAGDEEARAGAGEPFEAARETEVEPIAEPPSTPAEPAFEEVSFLDVSEQVPGEPGGEAAPPEDAMADELAIELDEGAPAEPAAPAGETGEDPLGIRFLDETIPSIEPADLLHEARRAFETGELEPAIAAASRVLAADPSCSEAAELIELARRKLEEIDREIEALMHEAHRSEDRKDAAGAERFLREVLKMRPEHREAADLLARLEEQKEAPEEPPAPGEADREEIFSGSDEAAWQQEAVDEAAAQEAGAGTEDPELAPSVWKRPAPPSAATAPADEAAGPGPAAVPGVARTSHRWTAEMPARTLPSWASLLTAVRKSRAGNLLLVLGAVVLLVGGWQAWSLVSGWLASSPDAAAAPAATAPVRETPREKIDVPSQPPARADATASANPSAGRLAGMSRAELLAEGREAAREGRTADAVAALRAAVALDPMDPETLSLLKSAAERLDREQTIERNMKEAREAFAQGRYDDTLRVLYRLPEGMQKGEIERFKRNAWYNLGVENMGAGDCRGAVEKFDEVLRIDQADRDAIEARKIAEAYEDRQKDLAYRQFVGRLRPRAIDAR